MLQTFLIKGNPTQIMNWIQHEKEQIEYADYDERRAEAEGRDNDLEELARDNYYDR